MPQASRTTARTVRLSAHGLDSNCLGSWQLVTLLADGPWSRVFRARPRQATVQLPSDYAIKLARVDQASHGQMAIQLLLRESYVGRQLSHPHLTCILSSQLGSDSPYLVMPYLDGATLESAIQAAGRLGTPHALWIARQVCDALQTLHEAGWLHADIKPSNIHIAPSGHATLLDLGLARRFGPGEDQHEPLLTGTIAYAAPESFGTLNELGPAADVYSLGINLYQMLTGRLPFQDQDASELANAHLHRAICDPRTHVPQLSPRISRLLRRMLHKHPEQRPNPHELVTWIADIEIDTFAERAAA